MHMLVVGGIDETDPVRRKTMEEFAEALGAEIVRQGHVLLNGCRTGLDSLVAKAGCEEARRQSLAPDERVVGYVCSGEQPAHGHGKIRESELPDWDLVHDDLRTPEPIRFADVVIVVGGFKATHRAANWARIARKPILPVKRFGCAAAEIFNRERAKLVNGSRGRLGVQEFEDLARLDSGLAQFAETVVSLAEKARASGHVFPIMAFQPDAHLVDALDSYKAVCKEFDYRCERMDEAADYPRILPEIKRRIEDCDFVLAEVSGSTGWQHMSPNVAFEIGYAEGLAKPMIVTARKGTELPFDLKDVPVVFWESQRGLKDELRKRVAVIAAQHGRARDRG